MNVRYLSSRKRHRCFALGAAIAIVSFWPGRRAAADSVELVSGEKITGIVRRVNDGKLAIAISHPVAAPEDKLFSAILSDMKKTEKPKPEDLRIVLLSDVVQIKFEAVTDRSLTTRPLIDNDRARNGRPVSANLKLRAGYHRFLLVYWHRGGGAFVRLAQSHIEKDNEDRQRFVRGDMLAHLGSGGRETPSPGLDKEGYRLPETLSQEVVPEAEYSVRRHPDGRPFEKMADVLAATSIVSQGTLDRISTSPFPDESDNLALLITGYLKNPGRRRVQVRPGLRRREPALCRSDAGRFSRARQFRRGDPPLDGHSQGGRESSGHNREMDRCENRRPCRRRPRADRAGHSRPPRNEGLVEQGERQSPGGKR